MRSCFSLTRGKIEVGISGAVLQGNAYNLLTPLGVKQGHLS